MTLGQKIKELRTKCNLTQEQLANYLAVSFQAVSKWENDISCPDISLIKPLTRLFGVTADELLGITDEKNVTDRREELVRLFENTLQSLDLAERQRICEMAIKEYPGDMQWICNLACVIFDRSFECNDNEDNAAKREKALSLLDSVIRNCSDERLRNEAIVYIVQQLSCCERLDEAKEYAMMLPEKRIMIRDDVMENLLTGEELIRFRQERIWRNMDSIIWDLFMLSDSRFPDTVEKLIRVMIPDGNLIEMNYRLFFAKQTAVRQTMRKNDYDTELVIRLLREMSTIAKEYDRIAYDNPGVYKYTSPVFDRLEADTRERLSQVDTRLTKALREFLSEPLFDALRGRDDFKDIL